MKLDVSYKRSIVFLLIIVSVNFVFTDCGGKGKTNTGKNFPVNTTQKAGQFNPIISFYEAALNGQQDLVMQYIDNGTVVDQRDAEGRTALMYAAFNGHVELLRKLISKGADVNLQDIYGRTALMMASSGPFPQAVKLLLDNNAEPDIIDRDEHYTALMYAAAEGQLENVKILLEYKANPELKDVDGDNALTFASNNGHKEVAELLKLAMKK